MKAVILAAGEGSRMRPLTYTRPKVMLPLANKPILEHLLLEMKAAGITEFIIIVRYHDEQVRDYFGNGSEWDVNISYRRQGAQLGTADALRLAEGQVEGEFLMSNGDIIVGRDDITRLQSRTGNTMGIIEVPDVRGLGVVEVDGERVLRIHEKSDRPPSRLANVGLYRFTPDIFRAVSRTAKSPRGEFEITDSIQWLIKQGVAVSKHLMTGWTDLTYPWDLLSANERLMPGLPKQVLGEIEDNVVLKNNVAIGQGTVVRSGSYIVGPVIIGKKCDIGPNCFIRAATTIGDNCHIGANVEVKNSIIMKGTRLPHFNYVGDSVIGENCNLGAGTKIANLKLDKTNVKVAGIDTGRRKLGAIIGDSVEVGINASLNVGCLIGNNVRIGPGALAHGIIAPGSKKY